MKRRLGICSLTTFEWLGHFALGSYRRSSGYGASSRSSRWRLSALSWFDGWVGGALRGMPEFIASRDNLRISVRLAEVELIAIAAAQVLRQRGASKVYFVGV